MFQSGPQDFFQSAWTRTVLYHFEFWYKSASNQPNCQLYLYLRLQTKSFEKVTRKIAIYFRCAMLGFVLPCKESSDEIDLSGFPGKFLTSKLAEAKLKLDRLDRLDRSALYRTQWGRVVLDEAPRCAEHGAISVSIRFGARRSSSIDRCEAHRIKARINSTAQATSCEYCECCHRKRGVWN